jgi:polyhydroxyalkanoate synthesis regulator protein
MPGYLDRNMRAFRDVYEALSEQSRRVYSDNPQVAQDLWRCPVAC